MIEHFRKWIANYLLLVLVSALAVFFYIYNPADSAQQRFFLTCFFYKVTGLYCPGCGGQRAVHQLLHGNIVQAADYNLLLVLALPVLLWSAAWYLKNAFSSDKRSFSFLYYPLTVRLLLGTLLLFWLMRNIKVYPFELLAP